MRAITKYFVCLYRAIQSFTLLHSLLNIISGMFHVGTRDFVVSGLGSQFSFLFDRLIDVCLASWFEIFKLQRLSVGERSTE